MRSYQWKVGDLNGLSNEGIGTTGGRMMLEMFLQNDCISYEYYALSLK